MQHRLVRSTPGPNRDTEDLGRDASEDRCLLGFDELNWIVVWFTEPGVLPNMFYILLVIFLLP